MKYLEVVLMVALMLGAMVVDFDLPEPPEPRYHVTSQQDDITLYLAFVNHGNGMQTDIRPLWVVRESQAWKYSDKASALVDVEKYGGTAVPMRGEK